MRLVTDRGSFYDTYFRFFQPTVTFLGRIFVVLFGGVIVDKATALIELSSNARRCEVALTRRGSDLRGWLESTIWPMISTALTARGTGQQLESMRCAVSDVFRRSNLTPSLNPSKQSGLLRLRKHVLCQ